MDVSAAPAADANPALRCLDAVENHRRAIGTLAGLLALGGKSPELDGALVAEAAAMIVDETNELRSWTRRLGEELAR